jgi:nitrous oxidase accessory protein
MRKMFLFFVAFLLLASCVVLSLPVEAASETFIVPDDYPTLSSAIGNATDGDTIFVREGTYYGPTNQTLVIDKSLSIVGENAKVTAIHLFPSYGVNWILTTPFYGHTDAINIKANDVTLENLTIILSPFGDITVEGDRTLIFGNNITGGRTLSISGSNCNVSNNTWDGRVELAGAYNTLFKNNIYTLNLELADQNTIGLNEMSYFYLNSSNQNIIYENTIDTEGKLNSALQICNSSNNVFVNNKISVGRYGTNLIIGLAANNTFFHNAFLGKDNPVSLDVTVQDTSWDNGKEGNYWADYNGTDFNGDDIGDTPYVIDVNNVDHYPLMYPWGLNEPQVWLGCSQTMLIIIAIVVLMIVVAGLLGYRKKQRHSLDAI